MKSEGMGNEKRGFDFAGAAGFDHVNGEVWHIHDLTKDKRTVCVFHFISSPYFNPTGTPRTF